MRHTYECPMRWADMDLLGHVNNVVYLEYLAEARENLFSGLPAGRAPVAGHQVEFVSPLVFHRHPVLVDTWVTDVGSNDLTLAHEVYDGGEDGDRRVYLRASTVVAHRVTDTESDVVDRLRGPAHDWRPVADGPGESRHTYPVKVRVSDLDERRQASDVIHFEYFQEARIQY